tara:strand:- start:82 stop:405 length:324 start_codon:yes stop_codon:yes gene_type:complete
VFRKLIIVILTVGSLAAVLLDLRQQRTETIYQISMCHRQIAEARYDLWQSRLQIAEQLEPEYLRHLIARAQLNLEPLACGQTFNPLLSSSALAAIDHRNIQAQAVVP